MWPKDTLSVVSSAVLLLLTATLAECYRWQWAFGSTGTCKDPFYGGVDTGYKQDWDSVYFGRVHVIDSVIPSLILQSGSSPAVFSQEGYVYDTNMYEVLCGDGAAWQQVDMSVKGASIPAHALPVGFNGNNETLYGCQALGETAYMYTLPGVVDPATGNCNVTARRSDLSFGRIYRTLKYNILVEAPTSCSSTAEEQKMAHK